jgi:hypothetical protein
MTHAITPAEYAKASATVTYVLNADRKQTVRTMTVNLTSSRLRGYSDAEGARRIIATTKGYELDGVCLLDLTFDAVAR